ncbi:DUF4340 domain-containing protein [Pontiellaceae bacterium B1224]|nr:DUF4340 domain-containing protein [Pontiellaceae bacterium B1224]
MTGKKLIGMVIALAVLLVVVVVQQSGKKTGRAGTDNGATLFQGLELNLVDGLEIADGSNTVSLAKQDGKWVVGSLYNYPVDFSKLAEALRAASEVKMGAPVRTSNVDAAEYGLNEAKRVELKSGGKTVAWVEIGARREGSDSVGWANQHFIRKDEQPEIYLVDYDFRPFSESSKDWINTELLNVRSADIVSVNVGDVELHTVSNAWTLADLDEETEEFQSSEANKLRMALQYLNCTSIADPALSDAELGFTNATVYTASTTNKTYTVTVGGEAENGRYLRFSGDAPEKLNNWTYVVSSYEAGDFLIPREKLVKPKEEPEAEEGEEP